MPCVTQPNLTERQRNTMKDAIARLDAALGARAASVVISPTGALAFRGWKDSSGVSDLCAYRALLASNSPSLRAAIARAEAISGRRLDARAVAAGVHSHDGGKTWGAH
jgi:hypothetical protein